MELSSVAVLTSVDFFGSMDLALDVVSVDFSSVYNLYSGHARLQNNQ